MRILQLAAAALLLIVASQGMGQAQPAPVEAGAYQARKDALALRYVRAIRSDRQLGQMVQAAMDAQIKDLEGKADPAVLQVYRDVVSERLPEMFPELERRMVRVMSRTLSEDQLLALVRFWESPVGRSVTEKRAAQLEYTPQEAAALAAFYAGDGKIMTPEKTAEITAASQEELADFGTMWQVIVREGVCKRLVCPAPTANPNGG